jgi:hypothetical protein
MMWENSSSLSLLPNTPLLPIYTNIEKENQNNEIGQ